MNKRFICIVVLQAFLIMLVLMQHKDLFDAVDNFECVAKVVAPPAAPKEVRPPQQVAITPQRDRWDDLLDARIAEMEMVKKEVRARYQKVRDYVQDKIALIDVVNE